MSTKLPIKDKSGGRAAMTIAPFKSTIRQTEPHRHNGYFEMIFLTAGEGMHFIDDHSYAVKTPALFVIRKHQVHCWDLTSPGEGFVLIIRQEFMDRSADDELWTLLASIGKYDYVQPENPLNIVRLCEALAEELPAGRETISVVARWLLKALLGTLLGKTNPSVRPIKTPVGLYQQYLQLLEEGPDLKRTIQYYAGLLDTTPQNLNNACRKAVDRSAADVLGDYLTKEAGRLLLFTRGTVAEISFALDFKDPSHFVKYFKRITGRTPHAFRKG